MEHTLRQLQNTAPSEQAEKTEHKRDSIERPQHGTIAIHAIPKDNTEYEHTKADNTNTQYRHKTSASTRPHDHTHTYRCANRVHWTGESRQTEDIRCTSSTQGARRRSRTAIHQTRPKGNTTTKTSACSGGNGHMQHTDSNTHNDSDTTDERGDETDCTIGRCTQTRPRADAQRARTADMKAIMPDSDDEHCDTSSEAAHSGGERTWEEGTAEMHDSADMRQRSGILSGVRNTGLGNVEDMLSDDDSDSGADDGDSGDDTYADFINDNDDDPTELSAYAAADREAFGEGPGHDSTPRGTVRPRGHGSGPDTEPSAPYYRRPTADDESTQPHDSRCVARRLDNSDAAADNDRAAWDTQGDEHTQESYEPWSQPTAYEEIFDELDLDLGMGQAPKDDTERERRATSSDEPPEGLTAPPDAYINQREYQDICADIRENMPSYKQRRNELRLMEPVTTTKPDAEVIARLAFWERVRRDDDNLYNLRRLTNGMSAKELRQNLVNKFSCDRRMLRSSTHKGDANKEELQSTYILFARAAANPDATPNSMPR